MGNENSGRYKKPENVLKEFKYEFYRRSDRIYKALLEKAEQGNLEAIIYVLDRIYGRPKTSADVEIKQTASLSPETLAKIRSILVEQPQLTIEGQVKELPPADTNGFEVSNDTQMGIDTVDNEG
jgi:F0F1-type ATP synthase delta subunit